MDPSKLNPTPANTALRTANYETKPGVPIRLVFGVGEETVTAEVPNGSELFNLCRDAGFIITGAAAGKL